MGDNEPVVQNVIETFSHETCDELLVDDLSRIYDPGKWRDIDDKLRNLLVEKCPLKFFDDDFPKDENSRHFSNSHYLRKLPNEEKYNRRWLVYSKDFYKVFYFCGKLFSSKYIQTHLGNEGSRDWKHLSSMLKNHEKSNDHIANMGAWFYLELSLSNNKTIDKDAQEELNKEKKHRKSVLVRIIAIVKTLAKNNLAFRENNEKIYQENNGNFFSLVEMISEFDQTMKELIRRIKNSEIHNHYLGHNIQNDFIQVLAHEVKSTILKKNQ